MELGTYNLFSDTSFGGPNIHLARIQLSIDFKQIFSRWVEVKATRPIGKLELLK